MPCITYRTTELYCETLKIQCTFDYTVCDTSSPSQKAIVTDAVDTSSSLDSSHEDQSPVCNGYSFGSFPPGSCGKPGDPHNLETGQLATRGVRLSPKAKASLDARYVGAGGMTNAEIARGHM